MCAFLVALLHSPNISSATFSVIVRPDRDDLVVAFAVGDGAVEILLLDRDHLLLGFVDQARLAVRHDHVVDADRDAGLGRVEEAEVLDIVEHLDRHLETEAQVAVVDQLRRGPSS